MQKVKVEKILGYLLLVVGLGLIGYSTFNVANVFKGKAEPYQLFSFSGIELDLGEMMKGQPVPQDMDLNQEIMSPDLVNKPTNMVAHVVLMGFVASAGLKVAQIGVMLIRTIKVKLLREKEKLPN